MAIKSFNTLPFLPECSAKHNLPHNLPLGPKEISCRTEGGMSCYNGSASLAHIP